MKEIFIEQMNKDRNGPDDTDWNAPEFDSAGFTENDRKIDDYYQNQYDQNQLNPPPDQINTESGKSMWVIKGYKIWAQSYAEALQLLPMIENF